MYTRMSALVKAREWFARKGAQFGYKDGYCVYRGDNDPESEIRCGIGCLLPNEAYHRGLENRGITAILAVPRDASEGMRLPDSTVVPWAIFDAIDAEFGVEDRDFWANLQRLHDDHAGRVSELEHVNMDAFRARLDAWIEAGAGQYPPDDPELKLG